ncbi:MAG TPA: Ig-like domain-containing protein, partial [Solirubrobacteraceae bacterium]|nr:Ig-like domain-containing protein [Solirubrobacteraceae bacterium]
MCAAVGLLAAGCSSGSKSRPGHAGSTGAAASDVHLVISPASGVTDIAPNRGIKVSAAGGKITHVLVRARRGRVAGKLNAAGTVWHSTWALPVSQHYTVTATATGASGAPVTQASSFRTFTPRRTFTTMIIEGYHQTYGVGMPIILYFDRLVANKAAVERSLQIKSSKRVVGAWYWDTQCRTAPECLYFRPRHYWPAHTQVSFTGHLDGVQAAPGVYGHHDLTQSFTIGTRLIVVASTALHRMHVYRNGKLFASWAISTGRPGDDTPNGTYLTIEKSNPVDMVGPGYNIEVPYSVRFTWSGDYLHDAYWSVGQQGFTNVSHGCVNMSPADAAIYYGMAVPGDPVTINGSPRPGVWDNGWTQWFLPWRQYLRGSALHKAVRAGPHGSTFISRRRPTPTAPGTATT